VPKPDTHVTWFFHSHAVAWLQWDAGQYVEWMIMNMLHLLLSILTSPRSHHKILLLINVRGLQWKKCEFNIYLYWFTNPCEREGEKKKIVKFINSPSDNLALEESSPQYFLVKSFISKTIRSQDLWECLYMNSCGISQHLFFYSINYFSYEDSREHGWEP